MSRQESNYDDFGTLISDEEAREHALEYESDQSIIDVEAAGNDDDAGWEDMSEREDDDNGSGAQIERGALTRDAFQVFGKGVEVVHHVMDNQDVQEPLIMPQHTGAAEHNALLTTLDTPSISNDTVPRFLHEILKSTPSLIRNVAIIGHLHHGKTSIYNSLLKKTQQLSTHAEKLDFTRIWPIEQKRQITVKSRATCTLAQTSDHKSYAINLVDTPGHADFVDEVLSGLRLAEGVLLVADAVEGLNDCTVRALDEAVKSGKRVILLINKIDRLILELRLPPLTAAARLQAIIAEVVTLCRGSSFDPLNVVFASVELDVSFTLESMARLYKRYGSCVLEPGELIAPGNFTRYVIEPFYKIVGVILTGKDEPLDALLKSLGVQPFKRSKVKDPRDIIIEVLHKYFEDPDWNCVWDMIVESVLPPQRSSEDLVAEAVGHITPELSLLRVHSGTLARGMTVKCSEGSSSIENMWLPCFGMNIAVDTLGTGSIALVRGVSDLVGESGFITDSKDSASSIGWKKHDSVAEPTIKIGLKASRLSDTEPLRSALAQASKVFSSLKVGTSAYGELLAWGTGELFLDCALYELRNSYAKTIDFKCSDPSVSFRETISGQSQYMCTVSVPAREESVSIIASPLTDPATALFSSQDVSNTQLEQALHNEKWTQLDIASIWARARGNVLVDDTVKDLDGLQTEKQPFVDGFEWAVEEGPLCEGLVQGVRFNIAEVNLPPTDNALTTAQLGQTMRRACHLSMLLASPKLLEPWFRVIVTGPISVGRTVYRALAKRRGKVSSDKPIPGTNLYTICGELPVIDSFGLETDIRMESEDQAEVSYIFCAWYPVPGNPLDSSRMTKRLEIAQYNELARDYLMKTRRRLGLTQGPELETYMETSIAELTGFASS